MQFLQVQPEFWLRAEEMPQAQGGVPGHCTLAVEDSGDAVGGHIDLACQLGGTHAKFRKLCCEDGSHFFPFCPLEVIDTGHYALIRRAFWMQFR